MKLFVVFVSVKMSPSEILILQLDEGITPVVFAIPTCFYASHRPTDQVFWSFAQKITNEDNVL